MDKPGYVINPYSGRYIKINSKLYNTLLHEGILKDRTKKKSNIVYENNDKSVDIKTIRKSMKSNDPNKTLKIQGDNIIKINKRLSGKDYRERVIDASINLINNKLKNNTNFLEMDKKNQEQYLKSQIYKEMVLRDTPLEVEE